jgi:Mrp family chromosome partitioning ATPase
LKATQLRRSGLSKLLGIPFHFNNIAKHAFSVSTTANAGDSLSETFPGLLRKESARRQGEAGLRVEHTQDEILQLVQRLFLMPWAGKKIRSVMISPVGMGNGSQGMTASVAETLAEQDLGTVCLVDANLQAPVLHREFSLPNRRGFGEFLCESTENPNNFVYRVGASSLWVMPSGGNTGSMMAITAEQLSARIPHLLSEFDYVLINAPAAKAQTSVFFLATLIDGVVLVVEADQTRREVALRSKQDFELAHARLLGVVLNNRKYPIPEMIYSRL